MMKNFEVLSKELTRKIENERKSGTYAKLAFEEKNALRRAQENNPQSVWHNDFLWDVDKIMGCPHFSRYADKTQVFSLYHNDDLTRRSLHVQLVSRISRTIGKALRLNLDLIEAIALGHDIGHPAFAHTGESLLDSLYFERTGRHFLHNIHSVRVLDTIYGYNLSLQTLNGIAAHNGELELSVYEPVSVQDFEEFDKIMENCTLDKKVADKIMPCTLEGAVVRISDIIAYLGKDRQDAILTKVATERDFEESQIGSSQAEMVNNLIVNVIENSYGKPYVKLDDAHFEALRKAKRENYEKIYNRTAKHTGMDGVIRPMMEEVYCQLLEDVQKECKTSPIYTHHIRHINALRPKNGENYETTEANQLVVDYIASMTDDYFIALHERLFPSSAYKLKYRGYFD